MSSINWSRLAGRELTPAERFIIGILEKSLPAGYCPENVTFASVERYTTMRVEIGTLMLQVHSEEETITLGTGMDSSISRMDRPKDKAKLDKKLVADIRREFSDQQGLTPHEISERRRKRRSMRKKARAMRREATKAPESKRKPHSPRRDRRIARRSARKSISTA